MKPGTPLPWAWKVPKPWDAKDTPHRRLYDAQGKEVLMEWADFADDAGIDVSDQNAAYIVTAANLHPRLLGTLRSTVRQLEAVPEDVPGWMQRTMLCRRARELATEAGETWAMGNGGTTDSGGPEKYQETWKRLDDKMQAYPPARFSALGSNGETPDLEKPTGTTVPVPLNLGNGDIIAPEVWEEHLGEKIPVRKTTGEVVGWAVIERDPRGGYRWTADLTPGTGGDNQ